MHFVWGFLVKSPAASQMAVRDVAKAEMVEADRERDAKKRLDRPLGTQNLSRVKSLFAIARRRKRTVDLRTKPPRWRNYFFAIESV
jgi:hypothetical protein